MNITVKDDLITIRVGDMVSAVGEPAVWGSIGGSLGDQADLVLALENKADADQLGDLAAADDAPSNGKMYGRKNRTWAEVSGGSGSVAWGSISGTITDQTDLQAEVKARLLQSALAPEFDSACSYGSGVNYVTHDGGLYRFYGPYQGSWEGLSKYSAVLWNLLLRFLSGYAEVIAAGASLSFGLPDGTEGLMLIFGKRGPDWIAGLVDYYGTDASVIGSGGTAPTITHDPQSGTVTVRNNSSGEMKVLAIIV